MFDRKKTMFDRNQNAEKNSEDGKFLAKRLSVLLSYATGVVAADSAVFVDFDTLPASGASLGQTLKFLLAEEARPLRAALVGEVRAFSIIFSKPRPPTPTSFSCEIEHFL